MTRDDFEHKVLALWVESRIPMTTANIQYYTKLPRKRVEQWLESLAAENTLDMILTQDGQVLWKVMGGAQRPLNGATTFEELLKSGHPNAPPPNQPTDQKSGGLLDQFNAMKAASSTALVLSDAKTQLTRPRQDGEKSYLWSMGLSLFGPMGWLYAGAWREAIPASAVFLFIYWLLPFFLLWPIFTVLLPASAIVGGIYAYKYNKHGKRQALLPEKK